jgi:hypothetical protein
VIRLTGGGLARPADCPAPKRLHGSGGSKAEKLDEPECSSVYTVKREC